MNITTMLGKWTPKKMNPAFWGKISAANVTLVASKISVWRDSSGNGRHLTEGTDSRRFEYVENVINGHPVMRSNGNDKRLLWSAWSSPGATQYDVFCIIKPVGVASWKQMLAGPWATQLYVAGNPGVPQYYANYTLAWPSAISEAFHLIRYRFDNASNSAISVDGAALVTKVEGAPSVASTWTTFGRADVYALEGDFAELVILPRYATDTEVARMKQYASSEYLISM